MPDEALFFRSLQFERVFLDSKTVTEIIFRHTDAKWAADMSNLPAASKAETKPLASPEAVREPIAEIPTALDVPSECDRQLLVTTATTAVLWLAARGVALAVWDGASDLDTACPMAARRDS